MTNISTDESLRTEMGRLGAREFEIVALSMDPARGLAALAYAVKKGAENPIPYAIKIFDDPGWQPSGEIRRQATNVAVDVSCDHCGGDRFVLVAEDGGYAPCKECNASANTERWVMNKKIRTRPL